MNKPVPRIQTIELPIAGMDCAECVAHVRSALERVDGVEEATVYLASEKAVLSVDAAFDRATAVNAVRRAGYTVGKDAADETEAAGRTLSRRVLTFLGLFFGAVLFIVVVGEWVGLFGAVAERIPWWAGLGVVLLGGYPVFWNVIKAAFRGKVISHTLMTLGVIAAIVVGEWLTAAVVVFFMRAGDYAERFTTERSRRAVKDLQKLAPQTARVRRDGEEVEVPIQNVNPGDEIVVRPGERIPVDGTVVEGHASVNQAAVTGESMPVDGEPGVQVFAASLVSGGWMRIETTHVGEESTFGKVVRMVEEAENNRGDVQRLADRFSGYYLPVVVAVAALTLILRGDPIATAAVLVVACSCSFALATPIAMLATIGSGARRGLLVKGGRYVETLAHADVVLLDKTGTLTMGRPQVTDVFPVAGTDTQTVLRLAATAEYYSEHPVGRAIIDYATGRGESLLPPNSFDAHAGVGVRARVDGIDIEVGGRRVLGELGPPAAAKPLEDDGKTVVYVKQDGNLVGLIATADTPRPGVREAVVALRSFGVTDVRLLTGANPRAASAVARGLEVEFLADLLPDDKIRVVREYQEAGKTVVMIGDGVNDAPALAQADVGIAMGVAGTDIAVEAAHVALMRDDWSLVPTLFAMSRRAMRVVRTNLAFTTVYNAVGLTLAALGILPPILAAAAQSLPDLGILANSSRLLRQARQEP